jgi:hypothetical protein
LRLLARAESLLPSTSVLDRYTYKVTNPRETLQCHQNQCRLQFVLPGRALLGIASSLFFSVHLPKTFILKDLVVQGCAVSAQNLEAKGLIAKIFHNKDLAGYCRPSIFFEHSPKIFIRNELSCEGCEVSAQNLEAQGLAGKIFRNKDLARISSGRSTGSGQAFSRRKRARHGAPVRNLVVSKWFAEPSRMWQACAF